MKVADLLVASAEPAEKLRDTELDFCGVTDRGNVRTENQDHFLICTIHPEVLVHGTSLAEIDTLPLRGERIASLFLVADGVSGEGGGGSEASRIATEAIARYVSSTLRSYHAAGTSNESTLLQSLTDAALEAHHAVKMEANAHPEISGMATTLTLGLTVWPWLYVVQLGDSRSYYYWNGELHQITRDQTIAQDLVDQGILPRDRVPASPFKDVLSSAAGANDAVPEVTRLRVDRQGSVLLFCTDGLTKHVSDAEIAAAIGAHARSREVCESLPSRQRRRW
jgi:serine/threonine protein phosphatase PrpC